jgi:hypothetical protein
MLEDNPSEPIIIQVEIWQVNFISLSLHGKEFPEFLTRRKFIGPLRVGVLQDQDLHLIMPAFYWQMELQKIFLRI